MNDWLKHARRLSLFGSSAALMLGVGAATFFVAPDAAAQTEPNACLSTNPNHWPAPSKPYFMIAFDTSGSMVSNAVSGAGSSCNFTTHPHGGNTDPTNANNTRLAHGKCAIRNTLLAFAGEANFGLMSYARVLSNCEADCDNCAFNAFGGGDSAGDEANNTSACDNGNGCGPEPSGASCVQAPDTANSACRRGGNIVTPMWQDDFWDTASPNPSNVSELLQWVDGSCSNNRELFGDGCTPMNGILRDAYRYFRFGWTRPGTSTTFATPLESTTTGERACRRVNIILVTDGEETCDATNAAADAAADLFAGWTAGGITWQVRTSVIDFGGSGGAQADAIAAAGGTTAAVTANNETELSQALANIISSGIAPEICDNLDNNCNGCSDEGYRKFCNRGKTPVTDPTQAGQCCSDTRSNCLTRYNASITPADPDGNPFELPCWNPATDATAPQTKWLCTDPAEICDNADNNCNAICTGNPPNVVCGFQNLASPPNTIDETFNKCGSPLACPSAEICDGQDDDCDNVIDNVPGGGAFSLPGCTPCIPSPEVCDGCDNNCNGIVDDGTPSQACGFTPPANCAGNQACQATVSGVAPGTCLPGFPASRYGTCTNNPQTEICDGIDNNCNGAIDEGIPPTGCDIPGMPGLVYKNTFAASQCVRGTIPCGGSCSGWIGPSSEICDGIDNDCNGVVDDNVPGVGNQCGSAAGQCQKGTTACVGGQLVCQGGRQPQPEVCNGLDDDCDGTSDDAPLGDAPTNSACWNRPATGCNPVCSHQNAQWCPPAGATCTTRGTLSTPCATGNLVCDGVARWKCVGGQEPGNEVCDGADNNCNSQVDEGITNPPIGQPCGPTEGECEPGTNRCQGGRIQCIGGKGPVPELCNNLDDDCDTQIDDGLDVGGPCRAPYDTTAYPTPDPVNNPRDKGECRPGTLVCNQGCVGGTGPQPEVCDGKDNDCDGVIDEPGPAPDGTDGTTDPGDPSRKLGDACGVNVGECRQGRLTCVAGKVLCAGTVGPQPEQCDCKDNDCNGVVDDDTEPQGDAGSQLCTGNRRCVEVAAGVCQCAGPCLGGEFPCPQGLGCKDVPISGQDENLQRCVNDPCGNCATKTVNDAVTGAPECGPNGNVPACVCKGTAGCRSPCFQVTCGEEQDCATQGPAAGTCQPANNCNFFGCDQGRACHNGACVPNPCQTTPCLAGEVCRPNADFSDRRCEPSSCANVTCPAGQECKSGTCKPNGCGMDCPAGQVCFPPPASDAGAEAGAEAGTDAGTGMCGPSRCTTEAGQPCSNGAYCNPVTGGCEDDPCSGVICPTAQTCRNGECGWAPEGGSTGGTGGMSGSGGRGGGDASAGTSGRGGSSGASAGASGSGPEQPKGVWGLATGGGGCGCRTAGEQRRLASSGVLLLAVGAALTMLRRKRRRNEGVRRAAGGAQ